MLSDFDSSGKFLEPVSLQRLRMRFLRYRGFGGKVYVDRSQVLMMIVLTVKRGRTTTTSLLKFVSILLPSVARPSEVEEDELSRT